MIMVKFQTNDSAEMLTWKCFFLQRLSAFMYAQFVCMKATYKYQKKSKILFCKKNQQH